MADDVDLIGRPTQTDAGRVTLLEVAGLSADQRTLYEAITGGLRATQSTVGLTDAEGRLLGPFGLMLISPGIGDAVQRLGAALRFTSDLTARARELAILSVAAGLQSGFEWWSHEPAARAAGLSTRQLQQLLDGAVPDGLDEIESVVVRVCAALTRDRRLDDELFAIASERIGHAGVADLVWLVGYYAALALALEVFAPPNPLLEADGR